MEGTILLAPVSYAEAPADSRRTTTTRVDGKPLPTGIGARLGPSARLIDESINDLRAVHL
ncbi:hypothetical protein E0H75_27615 [Kribbella capetownensis]|uniref:Uncharacterized protein n=1 Tax=Kribbella capetownensis TaxID=1572659 RepID=A0A4R0JIJ6_9ACTN|nr:hypothetical protein [Kribbella capetownensis]TCC46811.1 hypothetical protein E0H75_27615 [Kribbella capetownensis]